MLTTALPILQQSLLIMLKEAYMTQYDPNMVTAASKYDSNSESLYQKKAQDFALSAAPKVALAIYAFVKEIGIQATDVSSIIAPMLPPVMPGGPCTGNIQMNDFTIT